MDRRERDQYGYDNNEREFNRNTGYDRDDEHYHSARNLTNDFERHYQREHGGHWGDNRDSGQPIRSYHEGDYGDMYERFERRGSSFRTPSDYSSSGRGRSSRDERYDRDRFSNYQDDFRSSQHRGSHDRDRDYSSRNIGQGDIRRGYGISDYEGTSDRYNTLGSSSNQGRWSGGQDSYSSSRGSYGGSRYGSSMGDSFPSSNRGVPDTTYGKRDFSQGYGTGSTYGGSNYGGGTGYSEGHRGGSFGHSSYGSSSGNYGGYGSMGGGTYGGRGGSRQDSTSHNSDRGTNELGGF